MMQKASTNSKFKTQRSKFLQSNLELEKNYGEHVQFVSKILNSVIRNYGYMVSYSEREDLVQIGLINLIDSFRKYDETTGIPFHSYAKKRVFGGFIDEFRSSSVIPRRQQSIYRDYQKLVTEYASKGEELTLEDAEKYLDIEVDKLSAMILNWEARYSTPLDEVSDPSQPDDQNPYNQVEQFVDRKLLLNAISNLTEREQLILSLYFDKEMSLQQVASMVGLTDGRVSQIKNEAIKKIRNQIT